MAALRPTKTVLAVQLAPQFPDEGGAPVDPSPLYRENVFEDSDSSWRKKKTEIGCQVREAVKDDNAPWQCPCNSNQRFCSLQVI